MLDTIKSFFAITDNKYIIATIFMGIIVLLIIYILIKFVSFYKERKAAIAVQLPDINLSEKDEDEVSPFEINKEITIEMVHSEEEERMLSKSEKKGNENLFITALTMETGSIILNDESNVTMPEVEDVDFDKLKEEKKKEKEQEALDHLRELAKADVEVEEITNIENLLSESKDIQKWQLEGDNSND